MKVELLYFEGCPSWQAMAAHLDELASELGYTWTPVAVETWEEAEAQQFHGSPSLHIDGVDPFAVPEDAVGLSCRIYSTPHGPAGTPDLRTLRQLLLSARDATTTSP